MNAGQESFGDVVQYRDQYVKAEAYWAPEKRQVVILKEVQGLVGRQPPRLWRANRLQSRVPGKTWRQLALHTCVY